MSRIVGFVESVSTSSIQGWIANLDRPETLETVTCAGSGADTLRFCATAPRADVANRLGRVGCFGFSIPLHAVEKLGPVLRLSCDDGSALEGGEAVNLPPATMPQPPDTLTWTVLHVQKAAGTSLRMALTSGMPAGTTLFVYDNPLSGISIRQLSTLPTPQRAALRLVMGHLYFGMEPYLYHPPAYVTILRDPVARLRSHYHHHAAYNVRFEFCGARLSLAKIVQHGLTDEFDNLMTRTIAGTAPQVVPIGQVSEALVDLAIRNIRDRFRFVCLAEKLDQHFPALCATMGIAAATIPRVNVDRIADAAALDACVDWDEALYRNRFDRMLYQRVQEEDLCGRDLARGRVREAAFA